MRAYHNDQAIKDKYIARFAEHRRLDQVIQGIGFKDGKGCFVGCTLDKYDHEQFPIELGWPIWLAHLADVIFEGLPAKEAAQFGTDLLDAVPVGVSGALEQVKWKLSIWRHTQQINNLKDVDQKCVKECVSAIKRVIALCKETIKLSVSPKVWEVAQSTARSTSISASQSAMQLIKLSIESGAESKLESTLRSVRSAGAAAQSAIETAAGMISSSAWLAAQSAAWLTTQSQLWEIDLPTFKNKESQIYFSQERDMLLKLIKEIR